MPRKSYTANFKLKALALADDLGSDRKAANQLVIDNSLLTRWRHEKSKLLLLPKTKRALRGKSCHYPQLEKQLAEWIFTQVSMFLSYLIPLLR